MIFFKNDWKLPTSNNNVSQWDSTGLFSSGSNRHQHSGPKYSVMNASANYKPPVAFRWLIVFLKKKKKKD